MYAKYFPFCFCNSKTDVRKKIGKQMSFTLWKLMSLGFTCSKSGGNIATWHQGSGNKCQDTKVRETVVWVTSRVTHPNFYLFLFNIFRWGPLLMKLPKNFLQKIQDFQNVYDREVFSRNKIQFIWSTQHMISRIPNFKIF